MEFRRPCAFPVFLMVGTHDGRHPPPGNSLMVIHAGKIHQFVLKAPGIGNEI